MDDLTPQEKLQPCLLDRLTDDEPDKREESRTQRVISSKRYRKGVLRDLEWLFNASAHLPVEGTREFKLSDYPDAELSVINYGTRQLAGLIAPDTDALERELIRAIKLFEPRIIGRSLKIKAALKNHMLVLELSGELWANPLPEELYIRTSIDMETGQCALGEAGHG